jgi:hypothetical protein
VIPLFQKQIREGGPVTVTCEEMRRFFKCGVGSAELWTFLDQLVEAFRGNTFWMFVEMIPELRTPHSAFRTSPNVELANLKGLYDGTKEMVPEMRGPTFEEMMSRVFG